MQPLSNATLPRPSARIQAISLRQLRFFTALAESANFSRAAERMTVSQPALSAAIRQIEEHMGLRLFDRSTHHVALTEAGAAFLPHARRLLTTADNAFVDMSDAATRGKAVVRIGAIPSAIPAAADAVAKLGLERADLCLHLCDGKNDALMADLRSGALDLVIGVLGRAEDDLEATLVMEDEMMLVAPADHPLADMTTLPWSALEGGEIVHFTGGSIGELSSAAMRQNNLSPSQRFRVDQVGSLFGLVGAGLALGVIPRLYARGYETDRIKLIPLIAPSIRRKLMLFQRVKLRQEHPAAWELGSVLGLALSGILSPKP
ncbi:LysR family transcriptional regulator [Caulobacter sp. 1776]|uniref:LysR family transcriptional regulator n=1 Tax=Caulobacter sp. 1776 TaxID=3156420 RepID=UPI003398DE13